MISAEQCKHLLTPCLVEPSVFIYLPELKTVQKIVDRMKNVSDTIHIEANMAGLLKMSVRKDIATISTTFRNLKHPEMRSNAPLAHEINHSPFPPDSVPHPNSELVGDEVFVDIKKFASILHCLQVQPTNVIACFHAQSAFVVHAIAQELNVSYFLPIISN